MSKIITKSALAVAVLLALPACDAVETNSKQGTLLNEDAMFCSATLDKAQLQLDDFRKAYTNPNKIPTSFSDGKVNFITPMGWTSGFVAGSFWYMYEHNQDKSWLNTAVEWT
ncbi:hypothetical protein SB768_31435, partial [Burkholderia sp. SIMBA_043]